MLHLVQAEFGWVSPAAMDKVAEYLDIQHIEVYEVATFLQHVLYAPTGQICIGGLPHRPPVVW